MTVEISEDRIKLVEVRVRNFRSLQQADVTLEPTTVLIGENNSGKTSFLEALHAAIGAGRRAISEKDVFLSPEEKNVPRGRAVTIDILIRPIGMDGDTIDTFQEGSYWIGLWGIGVAQDDEENDFVAIRTQMRWNSTKGDYDIERRFLLDWLAPEKWAEARINEKAGRVSAAHIDPIALYFMDAKRDIHDELQHRGSFWHRLISDPGLSDEQVGKIEEALSELNEQIIEGSDVLTHVQGHLNEIYRTVPCDQGSVTITPLTRHLRDLSRGMDISFATSGAPSFPLERHGMGTRCLAALLVFRAYSAWRQQRESSSRVHSMLGLEEPEAHLHPQAQRALFQYVEEIPGQRIISTHSPYIAGQAKISQFRYFRKDGARTDVVQIDMTRLNDEDIRKINSAVLQTRGDLLYARALVLCGGETEEMALPVYAEHFWDTIPCGLGVTFVGVGGDQKYLPFLLLAAGFDMRWYVFSDGEESAITSIKRALGQIDVGDVSSQTNVFMLPSGQKFEEYMVSEGYEDAITSMLDVYHSENDYLRQYMVRMHGQAQRGGGMRDYQSSGGRERAMTDILCENKTKYSVPLASTVTSLHDEGRRFPTKVKELLHRISIDLKIDTIGAES